MSAPDRQAMLDPAHCELSLRRQCQLTGASRSRFYRPEPLDDESDFALMREFDELYMRHPFLGSRRLAHMLSRPDRPVNRKRARRLMRMMGLVALGPKPNTSKPASGHKIYPYLLRNLVIDRPNQVWAADITYIPNGRGMLYLVAVIDWASRAVLSWRLSNTMDAGFCVAALEDALVRYGKPQIFNTDQGSQFTSVAFTGVLEKAGIAISMDGRGRWMDNVFIERLWRSLKYEDIYLKGYADGLEARRGITAWLKFYNHERLHQALGYRTPMACYCQGLAALNIIEPVDMTLGLRPSLDNAIALPTSPQGQQLATELLA